MAQQKCVLLDDDDDDETAKGALPTHHTTAVPLDEDVKINRYKDVRIYDSHEFSLTQHVHRNSMQTHLRD